MFSRVFALLPIALLASASHLKARDQCNTGTIQCCNSTQPASEASDVLAQYGLASVLSGDSLVGTGCSSTGVSVGGGATCQQQPVCCNGNSFDGLIGIGCSPINVGI